MNDCMGNDVAPGFRAGFITFVGRPNAGKSTLMNALVGEKVAITSAKPQTTRRAIRGIAQSAAGQLIIVDTPGLHRPRTLLGERLNELVDQTLADVDVIGFCVPANEKPGPGDRFIVRQLSEYPNARKIAILTKAELVSKATVAARLALLQQLGEWDDIVPVSGMSGWQLETLREVALSHMPVSPPLYDTQTRTDESLLQRIAELIREAALGGLQKELPHSLAVVVDEFVTPHEDTGRFDSSGLDALPGSADERSAKNSASEEGERAEIFATLIVERDSQKGIVIGDRAERLKRVKHFATREIRRLLGYPVRLHLHVKVLKDWQGDPKQLGRLGF